MVNELNISKTTSVAKYTTSSGSKVSLSNLYDSIVAIEGKIATETNEILGILGSQDIDRVYNTTSQLRVDIFSERVYANGYEVIDSTSNFLSNIFLSMKTDSITVEELRTLANQLNSDSEDSNGVDKLLTTLSSMREFSRVPATHYDVVDSIEKGVLDEMVSKDQIKLLAEAAAVTSTHFVGHTAAVYKNNGDPDGLISVGFVSDADTSFSTDLVDYAMEFIVTKGIEKGVETGFSLLSSNFTEYLRVNRPSDYDDLMASQAELEVLFDELDGQAQSATSDFLNSSIKGAMAVHADRISHIVSEVDTTGMDPSDIEFRDAVLNGYDLASSIASVFLAIPNPYTIVAGLTVTALKELYEYKQSKELFNSTLDKYNEKYPATLTTLTHEELWQNETFLNAVFPDSEDVLNVDMTQGLIADDRILVADGKSKNNIIGNELDNQITIKTGNDNVVDGAAGNDRILGSVQKDTIQGGAGEDLLEGNAGDDIIYTDKQSDANNLFSTEVNKDVVVFRDGHGNDVVHNYFGGLKLESLQNKSNQYDEIHLRGIQPQSFKRNNNDLVILTGTDSSITIKDYFTASFDIRDMKNPQLVHEQDRDIKLLIFQDGFSSTPTSTVQLSDIREVELLSREIVGTSSGDTIIAESLNKNFDFVSSMDDISRNEGYTIEAGKGNDTIQGSSLNDTYVYNQGDGQDEITDHTSVLNGLVGAGDNKLVIKGYTSDQVKMSKQGLDLVLTFINGLENDKIVIKDQFADHKTSTTGRIHSSFMKYIYFEEDGKYLSNQEDNVFTSDYFRVTYSSGVLRDDGINIKKEVVGNNASDEHLFSSDEYAELMVGGTGNDTYTFGETADTINDTGGSDTYIAGASNKVGHTVIKIKDQGVEEDTLRLYLDPSQITLSKVGTSLEIIHDDQAGKKTTYEIENYFLNSKEYPGYSDVISTRTIENLEFKYMNGATEETQSFNIAKLYPDAKANNGRIVVSTPHLLKGVQYNADDTLTYELDPNGGYSVLSSPYGNGSRPYTHIDLGHALSDLTYRMESGSLVILHKTDLSFSLTLENYTAFEGVLQGFKFNDQNVTVADMVKNINSYSLGNEDIALEPTSENKTIDLSGYTADQITATKQGNDLFIVADGKSITVQDYYQNQGKVNFVTDFGGFNPSDHTANDQATTLEEQNTVIRETVQIVDDGNTLTLPVDAFEKDNHAMIPLEAMIARLGGSVTWNNDGTVANVSILGKTLVVKAGELSIDGTDGSEFYTGLMAPMMVDGKMFVSEDIIGRMTKQQFSYNAATNMVTFEDYIASDVQHVDIVVNGTKIDLGSNFSFINPDSPTSEYGSTYVPLQEVATALGATVTVSGTITKMSYGNTYMNFFDNFQGIVLNGYQTQLTRPVIERNGSKLVPLREIMEYLGVQVTWDAEKSTAYVEGTIQNLIKAGDEFNPSIRESYASPGSSDIDFYENGVRISDSKTNTTHAPYINGSKQFVHMRTFVNEYFGGLLGWDPSKNQAVINKNGSPAVYFTVGDSSVTINGRAYALEYDASFSNTFIEIDGLADLFGYNSNWDASTHRVQLWKQGYSQYSDLSGYDDRDDLIHGTSGADSIYTLGGEDHIYSGEGNDVIHAGDGDNRVESLSGDNSIVTGSGSDDIHAGSGADTIYTFGGHDKIRGGGGDDRIFSGIGNDFVEVSSGTNYIKTDKGHDHIKGGTGKDTIYAGNDNDVAYGGDGNDDIYGEYGNDRLYGGDGTDYVYGGSGNDQIFGENQLDYLYGNDGADLISGGYGDDQIDGGSGDDYLLGDSGMDTIHGGSGNDTLMGGDDTDYLHGDGDNDILNGATGNDFLYGGSGNDTYVFNGNQGSDVITDNSGLTDIVLGFLSNDERLRFNYNGDDLILTIDGYTNNITIRDYRSANLSTFHFANGVTKSFTQMMNERGVTETGSAGADNVSSTDYNDKVSLGAGNDTIHSSSGDDTYSGDQGEDKYYIHLNSDVNRISTVAYTNGLLEENADSIIFNNHASSDFMMSKDGNNNLVLKSTKDSTEVVLLDFYGAGYKGVKSIEFSDKTIFNADLVDQFLKGDIEGSLVGETLRGFMNLDSNVLAYGGDDKIITFDGNDTIQSGAGNDTVTTGAGNDTVTDTLGNDTFNLGAGTNHVTDSAGNDLYIGGQGHDTIVDQGGDDTIQLGDGNNHVTVDRGTDSIITGLGADTVIAKNNTVTMNTGAGIDTVDLQQVVKATVFAGEGNDQITSDSGDVAVYAGAGDDVVTLGAGNDSVIGEAGNDQISTGLGNDYIYDGLGNNTINAGGGNDQTITGIGNDHITDTAGDDVINAGDGDNTILVADGTDEVRTGSGIDHITSSGNTVTIQSEDGDDTIILNDLVSATVDAGAGNDTITGKLGQLVINGGRGNDTITTATGDDQITGGDGDDRIESGAGNDIVDLGNGDDYVLDVSGNDHYKLGYGNNTIDDQAGNDTYTGGYGTTVLTDLLGDDIVTLADGNHNLRLGGGTDTVTLGNGTNTITLENNVSTVTTGTGDDRIDIQAVTSADVTTGAGVDVITSVSGNVTVHAGEGDDQITLGNGANFVYGEAGNDTIQSGDGVDKIYGGDGNDVLSSGAGNDYFYGEAGNDTYTSMSGRNYAKDTQGDDRYTFGTGNDVIQDFDGTDVIHAGDGRNYIKAYNGHKTIVAGTGDDRLYGLNVTGGSANLGDGKNYANIQGVSDFSVQAGSGDDFIVFKNVGSGVEVTAGSGNDRVDIYDGPVTVDLGAGDDTFIARSGGNTVTAGTGNDTFIMNGAFGHNTIINSDTDQLGNDVVNTDHALKSLLFEQSATDLVATFSETSSITFKNWFADDAMKVDSIQSSEFQISALQIEQLIQAMAAFTNDTGMSWEAALEQNNQQALNIIDAHFSSMV